MAGTSRNWSAGHTSNVELYTTNESIREQSCLTVLLITQLSDRAGAATPTFWFLCSKCFSHMAIACARTFGKAFPNPPVEHTGRKDFQK